MRSTRLILENSSLIIGSVNEDGKLVAFSRRPTDFVFHALVYDVIVAEPLRGQKLGRGPTTKRGPAKRSSRSQIETTSAAFRLGASNAVYGDQMA